MEIEGLTKKMLSEQEVVLKNDKNIPQSKQLLKLICRCLIQLKP